MYPSSLFSKPLFATQDYIQSISMYSLRGKQACLLLHSAADAVVLLIIHSSSLLLLVQQQCSTVSMFPAFMDRDFMYPALLLKVMHRLLC